MSSCRSGIIEEAVKHTARCVANLALQRDHGAPPGAAIRYQRHPSRTDSLGRRRQGRVKRSCLFGMHQLAEVDAELGCTKPEARRAQGHREGRQHSEIRLPEK
jgi:hypothetical protein